MINLIHGDCHTELKNLETASVDMALCDPPYGKTRANWDTLLNFDIIWPELHRIVKPNGAICIFGAEPFSSKLRISNLKNYRYDWIWQKTEPTGHYNANKMPLRIFEKISVFYRKPPVFNPQKTAGHKRKTANKKLKERKDSFIYGCDTSSTSYDSTERNPIDILRFSRKRQTNKLHASQKPLDLLKYLINSYTNPGQTILDICIGSGSTPAACLELDRSCIGMELDPYHYNNSETRIQNLKSELITRKQTQGGEG